MNKNHDSRAGQRPATRADRDASAVIATDKPAPPMPAVLTKQCSNCGAPIQIPDFTSPDLLEGRLWSDLRFDSAHFSEPPLLGKCPSCGALGPLAELPPMPESSSIQPDDRYNYQALDSDDYAALLEEAGDIAPPFHSYLRIRFWQLSNDRRRGGDSVPLSEAERANMLALLELLGSRPADRLMRAQIQRQLEDFEGAQATLDTPFDEQLAPLVKRLQRLAAEGDPGLMELFAGDPRQAAWLLSLDGV